MAERRVVFRLPVPGMPRAVVVTDYGLRGGQLLVGGAVVLEAASHDVLARGVSATLPGGARHVTLSAAEGEVHLSVDGVDAPREESLVAPTSRSAWVHGWVALFGLGFGFVASWLYVLRARRLVDPWSMRMAWHMAAWHLLLTLTLFPASVWGQRPGIRAVQAASALFFAIHLGIALDNVGATEGPLLAALNAASGLAFLTAVVYGQRAHKDMDPVRAALLHDAR